MIKTTTMLNYDETKNTKSGTRRREEQFSTGLRSSDDTKCNDRFCPLSDAIVTSYQQPVTSYQLPVTSYQLPAISYQLPVTSYQLPATSYQLPATSYQLPATSYQLPATSYQHSRPAKASERWEGHFVSCFCEVVLLKHLPVLPIYGKQLGDFWQRPDLMLP